MFTESKSSSTRFDVTSIGETMLRLSTAGGHRLEEARQLEVHAGGAESNVCAALAGLGRHCGWASRLPENPMGRLILRRVRASGVDTSAVTFSENSRAGAYYVELAAPPLPAQVTYDRAASAAAGMNIAEVDWKYLLDTRVLHLTGITPAISESCHQLVREAIRAAREAGVAVSFDVNYRSKLWSREKATDVLRPLINEVDLLICKQDDARQLLGCGGDERHVLDELRRLTSAHHIVMTCGQAGVVALNGHRFLSQPALPVQVVDRFGAGDALAAGVLDGWLDDSLEEALRRGASLAALSLSQTGDMLTINREEMINASQTIRAEYSVLR